MLQRRARSSVRARVGEPAASTEPLNCFSGEANAGSPTLDTGTGFNGAAELLQRRGPDGAQRRRHLRGASTEPLNCFSGEVRPLRTSASSRTSFNGAAELLQRRDWLSVAAHEAAPGFNGAAELLQRRVRVVWAGRDVDRASTEPLNCFSGEVVVANLRIHVPSLQRSR